MKNMLRIIALGLCLSVSSFVLAQTDTGGADMKSEAPKSGYIKVNGLEMYYEIPPYFPGTSHISMVNRAAWLVPIRIYGVPR